MAVVFFLLTLLPPAGGFAGLKALSALQSSYKCVICTIETSTFQKRVSGESRLLLSGETEKN